jgi:methionyl-tRNA formyltransferase
MDQETYVIASSRPWNDGMAERLGARTGLLFRTISKPRELTVEYLAALNPRFVFFPHWSYRIVPEIFERYECVIFHMTDLPFGRGGSPLQNLIIRGIDQTKISALRCVEAMDAGPVYLKKDLDLEGTANEIYARASHRIEEMIIEMIERQPVPVPQVGEPTFFTRRTPSESDLPVTGTSLEIYDFIRMLDADGYPKAFIDAGSFRFEFTHAVKDAEELKADVRITRIDDETGGDR